MPSAEVRSLRNLLHQRQALVAERKRWWLRARSYLRSAGAPARKGACRITRLACTMSPSSLTLTAKDFTLASESFAPVVQSAGLQVARQTP